MREETRDMTVQMSKTVYIADDGAEFNNPRDCARYEANVKREAAEKKIENLPHFDLLPIGAGEHDDDPNWTWYKVSSEEELQALMDALFEDDAAARDFEAPYFPIWVIATSDGDGYGFIESYDWYVESARTHLKALDRCIKEVDDGRQE